MTRGGPRPASTPGRTRVIALSVIAGVLIVVAAAAGATAFVSDDDSPPPSAAPTAPSSSTSPAAPPPPEPAPGPTVPGTDRQGFLGTAARCADGDAARMIVQTAASQAVVCEHGGTRYYAGWRADTGVGVRLEPVLPAGPGWVVRGPDATINVTPSGLVISTPSGEFTEPATGFWAG